MGENYFGITDPGRQRTNNEDSFIVKPVFNDNFMLACVIDGVGGYSGGEVAAQLTSEEIIQQLDQLPVNITNQLVAALNHANERIIREKQVSPQNENMACVVTLAVADIVNNVLYYAHVGDTRLYLFRDGSLIKITRDHSAVGFLEESGRLSEEAAMLHPKRNEVNKALGYETNIALNKDFIDRGESPFLPGDMILLCSDGLTDMVPAGTITGILLNEEALAEKARQLVDAANNAGGRDNVTVVLVHNNKMPVQHPVTKPLANSKKSNGNGNAYVPVNLPETVVSPPAPQPEKRKKSTGWLWLLCMLLLVAVAWLTYQHYFASHPPEKPVNAVVLPQTNPQETRFSADINASLNNVVQLPPKQQVILSKPIQINNDSLHLVGNGTILISDSAYKGPAFVLSSNCKYIQLDSLEIKNFSVGISVLNKGLHLKQVRFTNCIIPLQFQYPMLNDTLVSGKQAETIFYFTDSLHQ